MNKRLLPAVSIGLALLLIGTLAYASDRRKKNHASDPGTENRFEEEIKAELLIALEVKEQKTSDNEEPEKVATVVEPSNPIEKPESDK